MKIRAGIIGAGKFSHRHIEAMRETGKWELVAACRRDPTGLEEFSSRYEIRAYLGYRQLLSDSQVEAVLIATPHHLHAGIAIEAARAGKHIMLEKPMALTVDDCRQINREVATAGTRLMVGQSARFTSAYLKAKEMIALGRLGAVVQISGISSTFWMGPDRKNWHLSKAAGGGYLFTLGIHQLDLLLDLSQSPVRSVRAGLGTRFHDQEVDDHGILWLNFENGVEGALHYTGFIQGVTRVETEIFGTRGHLKFSSREGTFLAKDDQWQPVEGSLENNWMDAALRRQWDEFAASIAEDRHPAVDGQTGQKVIEVIEAAFRSSELDREIWL
jgi:phthalate 4,5-cis-dihydrodiol dehydrogenase